MRISKILSIIIAFFMATTTINATEKEVNGQPYVQLNNGQWMPRFGIGTYNVPGDSVAEDAVSYALKCGYRHIDTVHAYRVERGVGKAVKESGIPRSEIWITSKLWPTEFGEGKTMEAIDKMLERLQTDYIDLLYVHQPMGDYIGAWRAMEEIYKDGVIRAIGVCNFYPERLADLCENAKIPPAVNQVELHPFFAQAEALDNMKEYKVQPEAWGPLAEGNHNIFSHPILSQIGKKYGKTAAQVALRWNTQRGVVIIPKSTHRERMEENLNIWDFSLTQEEMNEISKLDIGHSKIVDHSSPKTAKWLNGWKIHE